MKFLKNLNLYTTTNYEKLAFFGFVLAGFMQALGFTVFNQSIALLYGIFVGLQLILFFGNWYHYRSEMTWVVAIGTFMSVLGFAYFLYDQVHLKNDWYFLPYAVLIGGVISVVVIVFVKTKNMGMPKSVSKLIDLSVLVLFTTIYLNGLLSLGNIFNARQFVKWEQAKISTFCLLVTFGGNYNDAVFVNPDWGSRYMNLFFMENEGAFYEEMTAEVKVLSGNLGQDYMLKTYDKDEKKDARQL